MTDKKQKAKPKQDVLVVIANCRVNGLGKLVEGQTFTGSDIMKVKKLMSTKHYRILKQ